MTGLTRRSFMGVGAAAAGALLLPGIARADTAHQDIVVDGARNIRDIGGYSCAVGTVAMRKVYRGGTLSQVTSAGAQQLAALNLKYAIDFRTPIELQYYGPDVLPGGVTYVSEPIYGAAQHAAAVSAMDVPPPGQPDPATQANYVSYVTSPASRAAFARTLKRIASSGNVPLLFHDSAGAHRSGWLVAILHALLGVSRADINAEYLLSNVSLGGVYCFVQYLDAARDQVRKDYGDLFTFLVKGLGLTGSDLAGILSVMRG